MLINKEILIGIYSYYEPTFGSWTGFGLDNNWSTANNWNLNIVPASYSPISFGSSPRLAPFNNLTADIPYSSIDFNPSAGVYTISGNSFMLYSGGISNNSTNSQRIINNIAISGTNGIPIACNTANITLSGIITGANSLIKTGPATLELIRSNTYTGGTTISAGTVKIGNASPFGSGALILSGGGTLDLNGIAYGFSNAMTSSNGSRIINTGANINPYISLKSATYNCQFDDSMGGSISLLLGAQGTTPVLTNLNNKIRGSVWIPNGSATIANLNAGSFGSGDLVMGQALNVPSLIYNGSADSNIGSRNIQLVSGSPAGGGASIINNGVGVLTLSGVYAMPNTLTKIFILDGTNTGDNTVAGTIANSSIGTDIVSLEKRGTGKWILSGANTYTGTTAISAGTLKAGSTVGLSISSAFSVVAGAILDLSGYSNSIKGFASDTTTGTITNSGSPAKLTIATAMSRTASTAPSAVQLITGNLAIQLYGGSNTDTILANTNNTYNGGTTLGNGAGTPIVTRALLTAATIGSGSPGAITNGIFGTGPVTVGVNTTDKTQLYFGGTSTFNYDIIVNTLSGDNTFPGAIRIESSGSTLAGIISANQADVIFSANNQAGRTATVTGSIRGNYGLRVVSMSATTTATGSLSVTLANTGVTINDYNGNTTLSGTGKATLRLGASNQIPNGVGKGNLNALSGTFDMNGFNETINGLFGAGVIDGRSGNPTLTIGDNDTSSIFTGIIKNTAGSLSAVKIGTGTLTLTANNNTYSGSTSINAGTISVTQGIATALFTPLTLTVTFLSTPNIGNSYVFFPGRTVQTYPSVTLIGAPGRTGSYNSSTSTLTIA